MTAKLIESPPFAPSLLWYSLWLQAAAAGGEGFDFAGSERFAKRDFARCLIAGNGSKEIMLTVPVAGGSRSLKKNVPPASLELSSHGNWRHIHLGAIEASYGRKPCFCHLMPAIERVYDNEFSFLGEFNIAIHEALSAFLLQGCEPRMLLAEMKKNETAKERGSEIAAVSDPSLSLIDALMRYGPETVLALLALKCQ